MIILKVLLIILAALFGIALLILLTNVGIRIRYKDGLLVTVGIGLIRINLLKYLERRNRKKKPRVQKLSDYIDSLGSSDAKEASISSKASERASSIQSSASSGKPFKSTSSSAPEKPKESSGSKESQDSSDGDSTFSSLSGSFKNMAAEDVLKLLREVLSDFSDPFAKYAKVRIKKLNVTIATPDAAQTAIQFGLANAAAVSVLAVCETYRIFRLRDGALGIYSDFTSDKSKIELDARSSIYIWQAILCLSKPAMKYIFSDKRNSISKGMKEHE